VGPGDSRDVLKKKKKISCPYWNSKYGRPDRKRVPEGDANVTRDRDPWRAVTRCHGLNIAGLCKAETVRELSDMQHV